LNTASGLVKQGFSICGMCGSLRIAEEAETERTNQTYNTVKTQHDNSRYTEQNRTEV